MLRCRRLLPPCLPAPPPAGEINTLQGNLNWVASRQAGLRNEVWRGREHDFLPLCSDRGEGLQTDAAHVERMRLGTCLSGCTLRWQICTLQALCDASLSCAPAARPVA